MANQLQLKKLEPRDIGAIFNETFSIYGRHFLKLIAIVAIVQVPLGVLGYLTNDPHSYIPLGISVVTGIISFVASIIAGPLMTGSLIHAISKQYLIQQIDIGNSYNFSWNRIVSLLITFIIIGLALILMGITIIGIPFAIYFGIRWSFSLQCVLIEGFGPIAAISRSSRLVKDNWWRVFGYTIIWLLIAIAVGLLLSIFSLIPGVTSQLISTIVGIIIAPIAAILFTLLYFDIRLRKEGYSFEKLAEELGLQDIHPHYPLG